MLLLLFWHQCDCWVQKKESKIEYWHNACSNIFARYVVLKLNLGSLLWLQFEESERKRMKAEELRMELKHKKQWDDMKGHNDTALNELEQLQVHKCYILFSCSEKLFLSVIVPYIMSE